MLEHWVEMLSFTYACGGNLPFERVIVTSRGVTLRNMPPYFHRGDYAEDYTGGGIVNNGIVSIKQK